MEASSPDQPVSFEEHVKPLFRERDHTSMRFAFDLWSHEDVSEHADAILGAIKNQDAESAYHASLAHITEVRDGILRALETGA